MPLGFLKKMRGEKPEEEYLEIELENEPQRTGKISIIVDSINDYADSDRIQKRVREGNIVLAKIRELKDKDMEELKRSIARIRKTCTAIGGDIAGVSDDWVVATPSYAKIERQKIESKDIE